MVELCIHAANLFYLASFLGRDMLWLRILTCCGLVLGVVFFTCQPAPMYGPTVWHLAFLVINGLQIRSLIAERRRVTLTPEQERAAAAAFENLSRDELLTLLTRAMYTGGGRVRDLSQVVRSPLTPEQEVLRDVAFSRLSRKELLNLLTRKLWASIKIANPARLRRRGPAPGPAEVGKAG